MNTESVAGAGFSAAAGATRIANGNRTPGEHPRGDGFGYGGQEFAEQPGRAQHETHEGGDHVGAHGVGELVVAEGSASRRLAVISGAGSDPTPQWNSYGSPHAR